MRFVFYLLALFPGVLKMKKDEEMGGISQYIDRAFPDGGFGSDFWIALRILIS